MIITRGVMIERTGELEMFSIETDDDVPLHHAKMQADEVRTALDNDLNKRNEHVEDWAKAQASRMLTARMRAEKAAAQARLPRPAVLIAG